MLRCVTLHLRSAVWAVLAVTSACAATGGGGAASPVSPGSACTVYEKGVRVCSGNQVLQCKGSAPSADTSAGGGGGMAPDSGPTTWQPVKDCAVQGQVCRNGECIGPDSHP